jgi:hypothetical protein
MSLSLFKIESDLAELLEIRQQTADQLRQAESVGDPEAAELDASLIVIDNEIRQYCEKEVVRVDGVRFVWRRLEEIIICAGVELERQQERKKAAQSNLDRLKGYVKAVMESMAWREGKPRKLEGATGALSLRTNGGKLAVEIVDEALVPDEYKLVTVTMPLDSWHTVIDEFGGIERWPGVKIGAAQPSLTLIGDALQKPCPVCVQYGAAKAGWYSEHEEIGPHWERCPACGGTGRAGVPGCRLKPRGESVVCQ